MSKAIAKFEVIIRGTENDGPQEAFVQYQLTDTVNSDLTTNYKNKKITDPNFTKKVKDSNVSGELWYDLIAEIKTDESIS